MHVYVWTVGSYTIWRILGCQKINLAKKYYFFLYGHTLIISKLFKVTSISLDFNLNFMQLSTFPYFLLYNRHVGVQDKLFFLRRFKLSSKAKTVQPNLNREKQNFEIICRVFYKSWSETRKMKFSAREVFIMLILC